MQQLMIQRQIHFEQRGGRKAIEQGPPEPVEVPEGTTPHASHA